MSRGETIHSTNNMETTFISLALSQSVSIDLRYKCRYDTYTCEYGMYFHHAVLPERVLDSLPGIHSAVHAAYSR